MPPSKHYTYWTEGDIAFVRKYAAVMTAPEIADALARHVDSVYPVLKRLGIVAMRCSKRPRRFETQEPDAIGCLPRPLRMDIYRYYASRGWRLPFRTVAASDIPRAYPQSRAATFGYVSGEVAGAAL